VLLRYYKINMEVGVVGREQDRQYTYSVTLQSFYATRVAVEKQYVLHILSSCL